MPLLKLIGYNLKLHLKNFIRFFQENQLNPYWSIPIVGIIFGFFSYQIIVIQQLQWLYFGLAIYAITYFYSYQQSVFYIQQTTPKIAYFLRLSNNLMIGLPFFVALLCAYSFLPMLLLFLFTVLYALFNANISLSFTPKFTPFAKYFFEYNYGFRAVCWLGILLSFIQLKAIEVQNFPLFLIAGLSISFFQLSSSYSIFEEESFIRVFVFLPQKILLLKIKQVVFAQSLILIPTLIGSFFFHSSSCVEPTLMAIFLAIIVGIGFVLTKYAFYAKPLLMGIIQLLLVLSVGLLLAFPFLPFIHIFFYSLLYSKALNNLKAIAK